MSKRPTYEDGQLALGLVERPSNWKVPLLSELPSFKHAKRIALDLETKDIHLRDTGIGIKIPGNGIIGIAIAIEDGPSMYLPVGHFEGNMEGDVRAWLRDQLDGYTGKIVGANFSYDMGWLLEEGIDLTRHRCGDIQITEPLLDEHRQSYSLNSLCEVYGIPPKDETLLIQIAQERGVNPKTQMYLLPAWAAAGYAIGDAEKTLLISRRQDKKVEDEGLESILGLEEKILPIVVKMRHKGIPVDSRRLDYVETWSYREQQRHIDAIERISGIRMSPEDVMRNAACTPLFDFLQLPLERTITGAYRVDDDTFDHYGHVPLIKHLARSRKMFNLRAKFVHSVRRYIRNDRIHPTFNQLAREDEAAGGVKGARHGRMSCDSPNMQQQPSRDDYAPFWRSIYRPEPGTLWATSDYSAQEPRLMIHYCAKLHLHSAQRMIDAYRSDAATDVHAQMAALTGLPRTDAKQIYLGLCYGMGGGKLARSLGLPTVWRVGGQWKVSYATKEEAKAAAGKGWVYESAGPEAESILKRFNEGAPFVKDLIQACKDRVSSRGYIQTLLGRRCRFYRDDKGEIQYNHKALNRLIQGSAGDQTKKAMIDLDAAGFDIRLPIHDDVNAFLPDASKAKEMAEVMINAVKLEIPVLVKAKLGPSMGQVK